MKKFIAISLSLALILSALFTLTASAEDAVNLSNNTPAVTARGGRGLQNGSRQQPQAPANGNRQRPVFPGSQGQQPQAPNNGNGNKQLPQVPNGKNGQNQQPQQPGTAPADGSTDGTSSATPVQPDNGQQSQTPKDGAKGFRGGLGHRGAQRFSFETLLKEGVISQETYDAIMAYIQQNTPAAPADQAAPADGTPAAAPELPADGNAPAAPELPAEAAPEAPVDGSDVLNDLLKDGVITQEQYDAIASSTDTPVVDADAESAAN